MKNMRNQYVIGQDIYNYASYVKGVEKTFGSDSLLAQAIYDSNDDIYDCYEAGLVISYDSRGIPDIRQSWNLDLEDGDMRKDITSYLERATTAQLMDDNGMDVNADYTETYEEATVVACREKCTMILCSQMRKICRATMHCSWQMTLPTHPEYDFCFWN